MSTNNPVTAYFVKATVAGEVKCLLTIKWNEQNKFIADLIKDNREVQLHVMNYETTEDQIRKDLQELINLKGSENLEFKRFISEDLHESTKL